MPDPEAQIRVWSGEPDVQVIMRGKKVLDTRTGLVEFSSNPAMCLRDYLTSEIYGKGLPESFIDDAAFERVANACDEGVDSTVTTTTYSVDRTNKGFPEYVSDTQTETVNLPRFSCNLLVDTSADYISNINEILSSFRGIVQDLTGTAKITYESTMLEQYGTSETAFRFTLDDIIDGVEHDGGSIDERFNVVEVRFPNEKKDYEIDSVFYPEESNPLRAQWLDEDGGKRQEESIKIDSITSKAEALQMAEIIAKRSRFTKVAKITGMPWTIQVEVGDVVGLDSQMNGWTDKPFRVMEKKLNEDDTVNFVLREHEDVVYPWSGATFDETIGGTWLGDADDMPPPQGLSLTQDHTLSRTGTLTWQSVANAWVRRYEVQIVDSGGVVVFDVDVLGNSWDVPLLDTGNYTARVYSVSQTGARSPASALAFTLAAPVAPTSLSVTPRDWEIEVAPQLAGIGLGTVFEFDIVAGDGTGYTPSSKGRATTFTFTGLLPDTLYTVFVRTVNAYGESVWTSAQATTTISGEQVDPYLNTIRDELDNVETSIGDINTDIDSIEFSVVENSRNYEDNALSTLDAITRQAASREELRRRVENDEVLIDAAVYVDPESGTIVNRAFSYTDDRFTEAQLAIDGVDARITATVQDVELIDGRVNDLSSELELVPGQITATANAVVAEAIQALDPAHTFSFFDSAQGWVAVNGTISTAVPNEISVTWGDIENSNLNFVAEDNPLIRVTIERTAGTGWTGDLIIERDDTTTHTFSGIIEDIPSGGEIVRSIDLRGSGDWTGTINRVRLVLGASTSDEFTIKQIVIGKPDALLEEVSGLTARVTEAELDISANDGRISQVVTDLQTFEDDTANQFTQVSSEVDAANASITNSVFQIVGNSTDFEDAQLQSLDELVDSLQRRSGQIDRNLSYAEAINQLEVDVSEDGALARSIDALEAVTVTQDSAIKANTQFIQQVETNVNGNASALNNLVARVGDNENDILAQAGLIQDVQSDADNNSSAIQSLQTTVTDPNTGLSATNTLAQNAFKTADGNTTAITQLDARVTDNEDFASAQLQINAGYDSDLNELFARVFLGTNVDNVVTGLVIDGVTQQIEFQANSFAFLDGGGTPQVYWDTGNQRYVFNGEIVAEAGTFTGTVSGSSIIGGDINIGGGAFTVDNAGNLTATSADLVGGLTTSSGTGNRVEIGTDSTYDIWVGSGSKTDANGSFWIKPNGTGFISGQFFQGEIIETRYGSNNGGTPLTATAVGHNSAGNTVEISGVVQGYITETGSLGGNQRTMTITLKRDTTTVATRTLVAIGVYDSTFNNTRWTFNLAYNFLDTDATDGQTYDYSISADVDVGSAITNIDFKTFENKLG